MEQPFVDIQSAGPGPIPTEEIAGHAYAGEAAANKSGYKRSSSSSSDLNSETRFTAVLERRRKGEALGLLVDSADGRTLHVCNLVADANCPVKRYNAVVPKRRQISPGDYVIAVNCDPGGQTAVQELLQRLAEAPVPALLVCRPTLYECEVRRRGVPMGLDLSYSNSSNSLIVKHIGAGAVHNSAPQIQPGDRIVSVGGLQDCPPQQLLARIHEAGDTVVLGMSRPSS